MQMKSGIKSRFLPIVALLTITLLIICVSATTIYAAAGIDTDKKCTLTITVEGSEFAEDLSEITIPVSLYKVAEVDAQGDYTAAQNTPFSSMNLSVLEGTVTADDMRTLAVEADALTGDAEPDASVEVKKEGSSNYATGVINELDPGLYLVKADDVYSADGAAKYVFTSYLTALPSKDYDAEGSDEWNYDGRVTLKAETEGFEGALKITKVLNNYNETLGKTSFAFRVLGRDNAGNIIYDDIVMISMDAPGSSSKIITGLKAGSIFNVTEVYTGASYSLVSVEPEGDVVIAAGDENIVEVTFTNEFDGDNKGGYGVENHFTDADGNGGWVLETEDSPA